MQRQHFWNGQEDQDRLRRMCGSLAHCRASDEDFLRCLGVLLGMCHFSSHVRCGPALPFPPLCVRLGQVVLPCVLRKHTLAFLCCLSPEASFGGGGQGGIGVCVKERAAATAWALPIRNIAQGQHGRRTISCPRHTLRGQRLAALWSRKLQAVVRAEVDQGEIQLLQWCRQAACKKEPLGIK
jgi:hypothetical protein